jgi:hypothetical protein
MQTHVLLNSMEDGKYGVALSHRDESGTGYKPIKRFLEN